MYSRQGYHEDDLIDFTPELKAEALAIAERYVRGPMYTPPTPIIGAERRARGYIPATAEARTGTAAHSTPKPAYDVPTRNSVMVAALSQGRSCTHQLELHPRAYRVQGAARPADQQAALERHHRHRYEQRRACLVAVNRRSAGRDTQSPRPQRPEAGFRQHGPAWREPSPLVTKTLLFLAEAGNLSGDRAADVSRIR